MTNLDIESEIQAKGLTAPRVTPSLIESKIATEFYFTGCEALNGMTIDGNQLPYLPSMELLTFCVLVMRNGFTVTGESACASTCQF